MIVALILLVGKDEDESACCFEIEEAFDTDADADEDALEDED